MYKILIDTTDRYQKTVILQKDKKEIDQIQGDLDIVSTIKNIITKNNLKPEDISEIKANPGPGSFTGLKIGVTIANVFNFFTGKTELKDLQKPKYGSDPNIHKTKWLEE